jgi:hypothetical protein
MALNSPIRGIEPDTSLLSKTATFKTPLNTPIYSPIPGSVIEADYRNKTITIQSSEGTEIKFENVGTSTVTNGSRVTMNGQIGYTGDDDLEFTVFDKKGSKVSVKDFLKKTDPSVFAAGGAVLAATGSDSGTGKTKETTPYKPGKPQKDFKDYALVRAVTGVGLAPFHLMGKAFNVAEGKEESGSVINEEVDRIKKLMNL